MVVGGQPSAPTMLPNELAFDRWHPSTTRTRETLDQIFDPREAAIVSAVAAEVIEQEGPIARDRLAHSVASAFGLTRVSKARADEILGTVPSWFASDEDGAFLWPAHRAPLSWRSFRRSSDYGSRPIEDIALAEIANAMTALCTTAGGMNEEDLLRETLRIFGGKRITSGISARLLLAMNLALVQSRLHLDGEIIRPID
jgi:hypothetical protein